MSIRKVCVCSNMLNEIDQVAGWVESFKPIADGGMLVVDSGSTDGTIRALEDAGVAVFVDPIIKEQGYGPARNHLRHTAKALFPESSWVVYFDADERILPGERHMFRYFKDYLIDDYDVIAFPRIDWRDLEMTQAAKDYRLNPDWQARMTRLDSPLFYVRRLHEQISGCKKIFTSLQLPKINHFHRSAGQEKRDRIGKLCAYLHSVDEMAASYPAHHKEAAYLEKYKEEGL